MIPEQGLHVSIESTFPGEQQSLIRRYRLAHVHEHFRDNPILVGQLRKIAKQCFVLRPVLIVGGQQLRELQTVAPVLDRAFEWAERLRP